MVPGSIGDYYWGGATGPYFWVDPQEKLIAVMMLQASDIQLRTHYRSLLPQPGVSGLAIAFCPFAVNVLSHGKSRSFYVDRRALKAAPFRCEYLAQSFAWMDLPTF